MHRARHTSGARLNRHGDSRGWESMPRMPNASFASSTRFSRHRNALSRTGRSSWMPGKMYLQTHETIGHALELDRILGYELSFAGGSFVRLEDFGKLRYGSEKLTARADATLPNSPGSFGYDDDGVPAKDTLLIDRGILVGAITGRQMVEEANARARRIIFPESGGANRAAAFYRVPIERMTNINIDPGTDGTLDDIVAATERGILLDGDRSWSIGSIVSSSTLAPRSGGWSRTADHARREERHLQGRYPAVLERPRLSATPPRGKSCTLTTVQGTAQPGDATGPRCPRLPLRWCKDRE